MSRFAVIRHVLRAIAVAVLFAALFVPPVFAQAAAPDPTDLPSVADYLATGGAAIVAAVIVSWLAEKWAAFGGLSASMKWLAQVGLSAALGLGSWYLVTYRADLIAQLAPVFKALVLAIAPAIANQLWHAGQKLLAPKA